MRYDDINKLSNDEVKKIILTECKEFYDEFISKGIEVYRVYDSSENVLALKTLETRHPLGWLSNFTTNFVEYIDKTFFVDNGLCSRIKNALFTITSNPEDIAKGLSGKAYWCIPKGKYDYSYVAGVEDFNYATERTKFISTAGSYLSTLFSGYDIELEDLKKLIECDDSDLDTVIAELFEINSIDDDPDAMKFKSISLHIRAAKKKIPSVYKHNTIGTELYSSTELLFNCKEYYMFSVEQYNLMDIFGLNTSSIKKERFNSKENQLKEISINIKNILQIISSGSDVSVDVQKQSLSKSPELFAKALELGFVPDNSVIEDVVSKKGRIISKLIKANITLSDTVKKLAITNDPSSIDFIKNPSEELQLMAVAHDPSAIYHIDNPTPKTINVALTKDGRLLYEFVGYNLSEETLMGAIKSYPAAIRWLDNPSEEIQKEAIKGEVRTLKYILHKVKNVSNELLEFAIRTHSDAYELIVANNKGSAELKDLHISIWS